jgi:HD superfamily phosphohydrolase
VGLRRSSGRLPKLFPVTSPLDSDELRLTEVPKHELGSAGRTPSANPYHPKDKRWKVQTIRGDDAVYLYGPELDLVDAPEFQRLQGIKQLGTSYLVFRGAVHTRFEHSLGTLQKAEQIVQAVNRGLDHPPKIDEVGRRVTRLAALLHDLPHVPFGHTLEDEFELLDRHDENQPRLKALLVEGRIGEILQDSIDPKERDLLLRVLGVESGTTPKASPSDKDAAQAERLGERAYIADIVANTVCADVLDYIVRDLSACGMPVALGDRFLNYFDISPGDAPAPANRHRMALRLYKRGMPRPDVESEIIKLLTYRYELAERVFFHHAKNSASVMIGEGVRRLGLHKHDENFRKLSDEVLLTVLAKPKAGAALGLRMPKTEPEDREAVADLGALVGRRRLFKLAYLGVSDDDTERHAGDIYEKWGDVEGRVQLQKELAERAGVATGRVLVHLPKPNMMAKLAKVRVLLEKDTVVTFGDWDERHSGRVRSLNQAHERLWRVAVYLHPDDSTDVKVLRLVGSAARELFGIRSRYAEPEVDQPYLATVFDLSKDQQGWETDRDETIRAADKAAASSSMPKSFEAAIAHLDAVVAELSHQNGTKSDLRG